MSILRPCSRRRTGAAENGRPPATAPFHHNHAKKDLLEALVDGFAAERDTFNRYMADLPALDSELQKGAEKARVVATATVDRLRNALGY